MLKIELALKRTKLNFFWPKQVEMKDLRFFKTQYFFAMNFFPLIKKIFILWKIVRTEW
jgi:hypothetical protein